MHRSHPRLQRLQSKEGKRSPLLNSVFCILCSSFLLSSTSPALALSAFDADFNGSGAVDFADLLGFIGAYKTEQPRFDLDHSGFVDFADFLTFAPYFGQSVAVSCGNEVGNGLEVISGPSGPEGANFDQPFRSLTVHPTDANALIIGTERNGFVLSSDGGITWTRSRIGLRHLGPGYPEIWNIAWDPVDPERIYAATLDSPGPVTGDHPSVQGGVYRTADGGQTWSRANCGLPSSRITSIQVLGSDPSVLIAGLEGGEASFSALRGQFFPGGIYRSTNRGDSWEKIDAAENDHRNGYWNMTALADSLNGFITFGFGYADSTENVGFLKSLDGGLTWESFGDTLRTQLVTGYAVTADGQTLYANARDTFRMQISTDGGETWALTEINQANGPVAVSPADPNLVLYTARDVLYRSTDALATVASVVEGDNVIMDIVFAPSDPTVVYFVTERYLVYRSVDSGESFSLVADVRRDVLNR